MLLALSFPKYGHPAIAFIALVPLLVALSGWNGRTASFPGVPARRGFVLGMITGFVHYTGTMYWTAATVTTFGGLPVALGVFVVILLALAMAMFLACGTAVMAVAVRHFGARGLWLAPAAWVTFEYARGTYAFGGFPWIPLGNTMVTFLPIAQLASVLGVYGLSWFVVLLNSGFALAAMSFGRRRIIAAASTLGFILAVSLWGGMRLSGNALTNGEPIKVGLIQGNISQTDKWDPARARGILTRYLQLSREAAAKGAELLIWPEASVPFYFEDSPVGSGMIRSMVRETGVQLLLGSDEKEDQVSYNAAFMLDVGGATAAVHRKTQLVPFGEYVPAQKLLFFVGPLVEAVSDFAAGTRITMLPVRGHMINTAICFEAAFPSFHREAVREGSELLTTITNDAWYGTSSAPYQHFELASMRAIEQGRYLVRSANTGFSGIVDPYGRVLLRTNLFETAAAVGEARFVQAKTVYATIGDLAAFVSAALVVIVLVWAWGQDRKKHANR